MPSFQVNFIHVIQMALGCAYISKGFAAFRAEVYVLIISAKVSSCRFFQKNHLPGKKFGRKCKEIPNLFTHFRALCLLQ